MDSLSRTAPRPRPTPSERPDPEALLLEAISRRDNIRVRQLSQALVHRHGFARLQTFRQGALSSVFGQREAAWFDQVLLGAEAPGPVPAPPQTVREGAADGVDAAEASADRRQIDPFEHRVLSEVDAAIAAVMASFAAEPTVPQLQPWTGGLEDPEGALQRPRARADRLGEAIETTGGDDSTIPLAEVSGPFGRSSGYVMASIDQGLAQPSEPQPPAHPGQPVFASLELGGRTAWNTPDVGESEAALPLATSMESGADLDHSEPQLRHDQVRRSPSGQNRAAAAARRGLEQLRRQWPRAAALVRSALIGSSPGEIHAEPIASASFAAASSTRDDAPAAWDDPANGGASQRLEPPGRDRTPMPPTTASSLGAALAGGATLPPLDRVPSTAKASDAEQLRRRLAQQTESPMAQGTPAPRPKALAELGAWLPDGQLPRAS